MKFNLSIFVALILFSLFSCGEKVEDDDDVKSIGVMQCQRQPAFIAQSGLNAKKGISISASEKKLKGLVLKETFPAGGDSTMKTWQHPTWTQYGSMGSITTDNHGNIYVAPIPMINVLDNPPEKQNIIYKVDGQSAEMKPLTDLPMAAKPTAENPYGLTAVYFDCSAEKLYACSVAGSVRAEEKGIVYEVDPATGKVLDQFNATDAFSLCVGGITGEKRLYYGSARTGEVYSIGLTKEGKFRGKTRMEFSLDMLGPRGDDKAKRLRFNKDGSLLVTAVEFNYNLTSPSEKQETVYRFLYDDENKSWKYVP